MENHNDIIDIIKKQEAISPPEDIVPKVMEGAKKAEDGLVYKLYRLLFQRRQLSSDIQGILSGNIVSRTQCFFLLFIVGLFYLLMGLFVIFGMKDVLANTNINLWQRFQPYLAVISGFFILFLAFFIKKKPQAIVVAKYGIIAHSIFLIINALILEFIFVFPVVLAFCLALSVLAVFLNIFLVSSMNNLTKPGSFVIGGGRFAQDI